MGKRVVIGREECVGCEACVDIAPEVFEFDGEAEKAQVILPEGGDAALIEEAIDACPVSCISWEE